MSLRSSGIATVALAVLCGLARPAAQERAPASSAIQSLDEALARLPPIERENTGWRCDPAATWLRSYLEKGGKLSDEQWRDALLRSQAIRMRERWPVDLPLAVSVEAPAWLSCTEIRVVPINASLGQARSPELSFCDVYNREALRHARYQELGKLPLGHQFVELRVELTPRRKRSCTSTIHWAGYVSFVVDVVSTIEDVLLPAHGAALDAEVRRVLLPDLRGADLLVFADRVHAPELATTALSLEIELFEGTKPRGAATLEVWGSKVVQVARLQVPPESDPALWAIHVRGRAKDALRYWNAERYWDGELVIPLSEVPKR